MLQHLGIIMDGNRRWAKENGVSTLDGHKTGANNAKNIAYLAQDKWIKYLTLWALSNDNLKKRNPLEVQGIIQLINNIRDVLWALLHENVRFETIWDIEKLPEKSQKVLASIKEETKHNTNLVLTLALVYGGQDEIIRATKKILAENKNPEDLSREEFRSYLDTHFLPHPDLIIRTGGDIRHSGFLLFDSEYAEYYFTEKKWPEFDEQELQKALDFYNHSKRNFGK